jgi:hypothetical protein
MIGPAWVPRISTDNPISARLRSVERFVEGFFGQPQELGPRPVPVEYLVNCGTSESMMT